MTTDKVKTVARCILRMAGVIRQDNNGHTVLDMSLLREMTDEELMRYRNVGRATIGVVEELKEHLEWVY